MKVEIVNRRRNEMLKREKIVFCIDHEGAGTPPRAQVRHLLAVKLDVDEERVYPVKYETKTGSMTTVGEANVYDSVEDAVQIEPKHIILRCTPKTEKEE